MSRFTRREPNILITGTPGTGKSTIAKTLAELTGMEWLDVGKIAIEENCYDSHDEVYNSKILNEDKVVDVLEYRVAEGGKIVEYHGCDFFPERWFDLIFVIRTDNTTLYDRLTGRGYSGTKLKENLEAEIFQIILEEAYNSYEPNIIHELYNQNDTDKANSVNKIRELVEGWKKSRKKN